MHFCLWRYNDGGLGTLKFTVAYNSPCVPLLQLLECYQAGIAPKTQTDTRSYLHAPTNSNVLYHMDLMDSLEPLTARVA